MKKLLLFALIIFININLTNAQSFKSFLAKEGLATAVAAAMNNGITNPSLMLAATTSDKSSGMPDALTPKIDLNTGQATVWLYRIVEASDTSKSVIVGVVKVTIIGTDQFIPSVIPTGSMSNELPSITKPLPGMNWKNSDSMMISLNANSVFQTFKNSYTNARIQFTLVGINTFNPIFELDIPYWFAIITADNSPNPINCVTNAWTGVTTCTNLNSVAEDNHGQVVKMFPNPASNLLSVEIPKTWNAGNLTVTIFNYSGNEVLRSTAKNTTDYLQLPLDFLPNGEYIISLTDGNNIVEQLFEVSK